MSQITITYRCCGATYSMPSEIFGPASTVPALDKLHAEQHPSCPPLGQPANQPGEPSQHGPCAGLRSEHVPVQPVTRRVGYLRVHPRILGHLLMTTLEIVVYGVFTFACGVAAAATWHR